jgi:hypothetical protein
MVFTGREIGEPQDQNNSGTPERLHYGELQVRPAGDGIAGPDEAPIWGERIVTTAWESNPTPLDQGHYEGGCFNPPWAT